MSDKVYVFGCGCRTAAPLHAPTKQSRRGRVCPNCWDANQGPQSKHNRNCRLVRIDTTCEKCGIEISLDGQACKAVVLFLCPLCKARHDKLLRYKRARKLEAERRRVGSRPPKSNEVLLTCPKCRRQRYGKKEKFSTRQTFWKYCDACKGVQRTFGDHDPAFYTGDEAVVNGKRVAL